MIIKRDKYLDKLINLKDTDFVKIITGIRRVGKSFLLFKLYYDYLIDIGIDNEHIIRLSLDEQQNHKLYDLDCLRQYLLDKIVDNQKYYIFIDEIQFVKPKVDHNTNTKITFVHLLNELAKKADVYVTGSNSKMLSSEILTEFAGRGFEIHVYPLTYKEITTQFNEFDLNQYFMFGGLPQVLLFNDFEQKKQYLKTIYDLVYKKDIVNKYHINKQEYILNDLLNVISSNISCLTSNLKLANTFNSTYKIKISSNTIKKYLDIFVDSYLIRKCLRFDIKGKKLINATNKYYFNDLGIRNACIDFNQAHDLSHIFENIVFNELLYRGYDVKTGVITKFTKNNNITVRNEYEIDFLITKNDARKIYIQVAQNIYAHTTKEREINALKVINDAYKKIIIVYDDIIAYYDEYGILYISIKEFLLNDSYLN